MRVLNNLHSIAMKFTTIILSFLIFFLANQLNCFALDILDLGFNSPPNNGVYSGSIGSAHVWISNGATHQYLATGGWNGSGGVKFSPPQPAQGYSGLTPDFSGNYSQLNLRYLVKYSSGFANATQGDTNKVAITHRTPYSDGTRTWLQGQGLASSVGGDHQLMVAHRNTEFFVHGANTACPNSSYITAKCRDADGFHRSSVPVFKIQNYENQWICIEWENRNNGLVKMYIWTQDGIYTGQYLWTENGPTTNIASYPIIGGFQNGINNNTSYYYIFDEMKIATEFIGPPAGFLERPMPPILHTVP